MLNLVLIPLQFPFYKLVRLIFRGRLLSVLSPILFVAGFNAATAQKSTIPDKLTDSLKTFKHKNSFLVAPLVSSTPETSWAFAIAGAYIFKTDKKDSNLRTSTMPAGVTYTVNNQILAAWGGNIFLPKEKYIIRWESSFSNFPDKFWGIGINPNTDTAQFERYSFTQLYLNPQILKKVSKVKGHFAGVGWDFQQVFKVQYGKDYLPDFNKESSFFDTYNVTGRKPYVVSGFGIIYSYDVRNHAYCPDKGAMFKVKINFYSKYTGSDYAFQIIEIDFRRFIKLYKKHVLGIQGYSWSSFGDVPYRSLYALGNYNLMRGYYSGRFRDKDFIGAQVEYRFPIYWRFSGVTFLGAGQVAPALDSYNLSNFKYSIGGGLRFAILPKEKLNIRFDAAWGGNGNFNTYVILAESF